MTPSPPHPETGVFLGLGPSGPKGKGVFAQTDLDSGTVVGRFEGTPAPRSRWTLQCGPDFHIEAPPESPFSRINHSCNPNLDLWGHELRTRRIVVAGEELTLDYTLYESELAHPFLCACGMPDCIGEVRGFLHLDAAARATRVERFPDWVRAAIRQGV
jgi:hypothetical protein